MINTTKLFKWRGIVTLFTIKKTVLLGFGLILVLLVIIVGTALLEKSKIQSTVATVVNVNQPAVVKSLELESKINEISTALGMYLLSKEETSKKTFVEGLNVLTKDLKELQNQAGVSDDDVSKKLVNSLVKDVEKFSSYKDKLLKLADSPEENIPAVRYALSKVNPLSRKVLQLVTKLADIEGGRGGLFSGSEVIANDIESLRFSWENMIGGMRTFLVYRDNESLKEIENYKNLAIELTVKLKEQESRLLPESNVLITKIDKLINKTNANIDRVVEIHGGNEWRRDAHLIRTEIGPVLASIKNKLNKLISIQQEKINLSSSELINKLKESRLFLIVSIFAGVLFVVFICRLTLSKVMDIVKRVKNALTEFTGGNLTYRMEATGDGEISIIANEFNRFANDIQSIIKDITNVSEELSDTSTHMAETAKAARESTEKQRDDSEQSSRSIQELSHCVQDVAKSATEASNAADLAEEEVIKGVQIVDQAICTINELANQVTSSASTISELKNNSESIGIVLDVIKGIAEQTNLLALNAAIEAARAGEQGRGFAVVADEVRTLASRTQESTQEIHSIIEKLQVGAENAVHEMERGSQQAETSVEHSAKAGESLQSINEAISKIKQMNNQIAAAAEEQGIVSGHINENVTNINQRTARSAERSQQTAIISDELSDLALNLKSKVDHFDI